MEMLPKMWICARAKCYRNRSPASFCITFALSAAAFCRSLYLISLSQLQWWSQQLHRQKKWLRTMAKDRCDACIYGPWQVCHFAIQLLCGSHSNFVRMHFFWKVANDCFFSRLIRNAIASYVCLRLFYVCVYTQHLFIAWHCIVAADERVHKCFMLCGQSGSGKKAWLGDRRCMYANCSIPQHFVPVVIVCSRKSLCVCVMSCAINIGKLCSINITLLNKYYNSLNLVSSKYRICWGRRW